jgi:hypothetical protein
VGIDDQQAIVQAPRALAGAKGHQSAIGGNKAWGKVGRTDHGGLLIDLARRGERPVVLDIHAIEHEPFLVKGNEGQAVIGPAALQAKERIGRQIRGNIFGSSPLKGNAHEMSHLVALHIMMIVDVASIRGKVGVVEAPLVLRYPSQRARGDIPGVDLCGS